MTNLLNQRSLFYIFLFFLVNILPTSYAREKCRSHIHRDKIVLRHNNFVIRSTRFALVRFFGLAYQIALKVWRLDKCVLFSNSSGKRKWKKFGYNVR